MPASPKTEADDEIDSLLAQPEAQPEVKVEAKPEAKAEEKPAYKPVDVEERTKAEQELGRRMAAVNARSMPAPEPNQNVKVDLRPPTQMFSTPAPKVTGSITS